MIEKKDRLEILRVGLILFAITAVSAFILAFVNSFTAPVIEENNKKAQEAAMLAGSLFGWQTPAADPKNYDDNGDPIKPAKKKNREYER